MHTWDLKGFICATVNLSLVKKPLAVDIGVPLRFSIVLNVVLIKETLHPKP